MVGALFQAGVDLLQIAALIVLANWCRDLDRRLRAFRDGA